MEERLPGLHGLEWQYHIMYNLSDGIFWKQGRLAEISILKLLSQPLAFTECRGLNVSTLFVLALITALSTQFRQLVIRL